MSPEVSGFNSIIETGHTNSEWIGARLIYKLLNPYGIEVAVAPDNIDIYSGEIHNCRVHYSGFGGIRQVKPSDDFKNSSAGSTLIDAKDWEIDEDDSWVQYLNERYGAENLKGGSESDALLRGGEQLPLLPAPRNEPRNNEPVRDRLVRKGTKKKGFQR